MCETDRNPYTLGSSNFNRNKLMFDVLGKNLIPHMDGNYRNHLFSQLLSLSCTLLNNNPLFFFEQRITIQSNARTFQ